MANITAREQELMRGKNFCHVATLRRDGSVHMTVVWVDTDGEHVLLNTADGRDWIANLRRDPRVTLTVTNHENPLEYTEVRGRFTGETTEGAREHIDALSARYTGAEKYPGPPEERRLIVEVTPDSTKLRGA